MNLSSRAKQRCSDVSLILVALAWGGGFVAVKGALASVSPFYLMAIRMLLASSLFVLFLRKQVGHITKKDWLSGAVVGLFLFLGFAFQTVGLQYTTVSKQGFLTAVYVVLVPLLYWMLYRKMPQKKVFIGCVVTLVGIGLISLEQGTHIGRGDWLTLVCALFFAMHILAIEHYAKHTPPIRLAFLQMLCAGVYFSTCAVIFEPFPSALSWGAWRDLIYLAVVSTFFCFTVQTVAQKYTTSARVSIFLSLESVFAALLGVIVLGESLTPRMIGGCALIFAAVLLVEVQWAALRRKSIRARNEKQPEK